MRNPRHTSQKYPPPCPACGSDDTVPIVYGLPTPETVRKADAGQCVLGGCCRSGDDPRRYCRDCGHSY